MTPHRLRRAFGVALAAIALSPAVAAEVVDIDWSAAGRFERSLTVAAGKFVEVCGKLPKGTRVRWEFAADRALDFNVHYHVGKDVVYPAKREGVDRAADALDAPLDQDYCWMWENRSGAAAKVAVALSR